MSQARDFAPNPIWDIVITNRSVPVQATSVDVPASRIHVMTGSDGKHYGNIEIVVPPNPLFLKCRPGAVLNTAELFEVRDE